MNRQVSTHKRGCAAHIRTATLAATPEATPDHIAEKITACCGHSPLKAQRLARGWTLADALDAWADLPDPVAPPTTSSHLCGWENGTEHPSGRAIQALCQLYSSRADLLGYGADYTVDYAPHTMTATLAIATAPATAPLSYPASDPPAVPTHGSTPCLQEDDMQRRGFIGGFLGTGLQAVLTRVAGVRQSTDLTLGTSTVAPAKLDHLELITDSYARAYLTRPPVELLMQITGTLAEVQNLAATRQPLDTQRRLWYLTGALAGLTGMVLINLGAEAHAEARATFGTARTAAEGHGDRKLRAWLLTQEAVIDLYYGDPGAVIDLAEQARLLAGSSPSSASAWAHALLARAHARRGEHRDALSALHRCEAIVAALDPYPAERAESALGYTPRQAHFHAGNVLTTVGDLGAALPHQRAALNLYPADNYMDRTLVHHDQARGLVAAGRPEEGCALLAETIADIPVDYRVDLVKAPARDILASIGNQHRKLPEARGLRDLLAIGPAR